MAISDFNYQYTSSGSVKKKLGLALFAVVVVGSLGFGYRTYYSQSAQVNRLVASYYKASVNGDTKKLSSLESKSLKAIPNTVLGAKTTNSSDDNQDVPKRDLSISVTKLNKKVGAITGRITTEESTLQGTPFLAAVIKEDGKWKIDVFNIGLITPDDLK